MTAFPKAAQPEAAQRERLAEKLRRELGATVLDALACEATEDVCRNPDGKLWRNAIGEGWRCIGQMSSSQASVALGTIAAIRGTVIHHEHPVLETELPLDGSRFEGLVSPVVVEPTFAIRTRPRRVFPIEEYVARGILTHKEDPTNRARERRQFQKLITGAAHAEVLMAAIRDRRNVLIVGSTGSGKTTLVNTCLELVKRFCPDDRVVSIEDTMELRNPVENAVDLRAVGNVTMLDCLRAALRLKPKRIVVGEVRGGEALVMLKAWTTGHPGGIATVHANDALGGLIRLQALVAEATAAPQYDLIGEAVDVVVFIDEDRQLEAGRKVREVLLVHEWKEGKYECTYV